MSEFIGNLDYNPSDCFDGILLKKIIDDYFKEHVSSLDEMNTFAARLRTYSDFVTNDLQLIYKSVICACCNKYGIDRGTIKTISLIKDTKSYCLLFPNDMFISDVCLIKKDYNVAITTMHEFANIADDLILKYNIDMASILKDIGFSCNNIITKEKIESIMTKLK